ncbi:hypothetical protein B0H17DRAFT_1108097 [Mycena rosella]|uniref:Uncharacterized protein n=1 Tax=Mycena rosella TaxID=1033263 RepID=A0AAD7FRK4_MYCRO|nr:hypothetical protein B0H17DRAFT_1108097 [Mycena rosella]
MLDILTFLLAVVLWVSAMIIPLGLLFGIFMPFVGVLVRYRANYTPKFGGVHLGEEGLVAAPSADSLSYFAMIRRVHRIERWAGLYKGTMPSILASLIVAVIIMPISLLLSLGHTVLPNGRVHMPAQAGIAMWILNFALSTIPVMLLIPMQIITNRAITTPQKLATFDAAGGLRALLSPAERAQPLRLYRTPGVVLAILLEALVGPALSLLEHTAAPRLPLGPALGAALPVIAIATALLTPLQVLGTRLMLQRLDDAPAADADAPPAYEEVVMDFRTQGPPYTGLFDCARTMVREEGARVLFRAWWLTALVMVLPLLAQALAPPAA